MPCQDYGQCDDKANAENSYEFQQSRSLETSEGISGFGITLVAKSSGLLKIEVLRSELNSHAFLFTIAFTHQSKTTKSLQAYLNLYSFSYLPYTLLLAKGN